MTDGGAAKPSRQWMATVVVAILGLAGTVLAGWLGATATTDSITAQLQDERAASDRTRRADVYAEFLKSASAHEAAIEALNLCTEQAKANEPPVPPVPQPDESRVPSALGSPGYPECSALYDADVVSWEKLLASYVQVYVWGSSDAVKAADGVRHALDARRTGATVGDLLGFDGAHKGFLAVMCRELPAIPRADC